MLRVDHLRKVYGGFEAVADLSFALRGGTVTGFFGPNGAGKTTTMRCLAGLIPPTAGDIRIGGSVVDTTSPDVKRRVMFVPDDPPLFDDLTVVDHLRLIRRLYADPSERPTRGQTDRRIGAWLEEFHLSDKHAALGGDLSRGMRQKLAVAMAAAADPDAILLDEPLTGLDPPSIRRLLDRVRSWADAGKIVLVSSHLLAMVRDVCTDALFIHRGRLRYAGPVDRSDADELQRRFEALTSDG